MTSATAIGNKPRASKAALSLEIALGKKRIALSEFRPEELQALLAEQLAGKDMKDLRGFRELREALPQQGGEPLRVSDAASLNCVGFSPSYPFTLKSHVMRVCRGCISQTEIYRRYESDEETTSWKKFNEWGRTGYIHRGEAKLLFMRRPPDAYWEDHPLVEVAYSYTKIPNEKLWLIETVSAKSIPIVGFCKHFGKNTPDVARDLFWELGSIYSRTADELEHKAKAIRSDAQNRERLSHSVA